LVALLAPSLLVCQLTVVPLLAVPTVTLVPSQELLPLVPSVPLVTTRRPTTLAVLVLSLLLMLTARNVILLEPSVPFVRLTTSCSTEPVLPVPELVFLPAPLRILLLPVRTITSSIPPRLPLSVLHAQMLNAEFVVPTKNVLPVTVIPPVGVPITIGLDGS
jgi:hypothetical protein